MAGLLGSIGLGVFLGWKGCLPAKILKNNGRIITIALIFLLIGMGLKIGTDKQTFLNLGRYGFQAVFFALGTIALSLGTVFSLERFFTKGIDLSSMEAVTEMTASDPHPYRMTFLITAAFALGVLLGFTIAPTWVRNFLPSFTSWALNFTLFAVGIDLGQNKGMWKQLLGIGRFVFLAPLGSALGSIIAGMIVGKLFGWTFGEGGAVGAGFGWYSLSGVMIAEIHSTALGTIAFLSNVLRELLAIILIPFLAGRVGKLTLISPGGAATMDTILPIIAAVGPPGIAIIAFIHGVVLSFLVPILVPLLLKLG